MKAKIITFVKSPRLYVSVFFLCYLAIGLSVYKDYGISWDEPTHREIALVNAKYLAEIFLPGFHPAELAALPSLTDYSAKQYGIIFDLPMYFAEALLGLSGRMPEAYYLRHLCAFLLFYASIFYFYLIVRNRFDSRLLGLTGCLFLVLSPRFFAESFYGKDVVFLSLFIISTYYFIRYLNSQTLVNSLLFALVSALVMDQRITGLFIPFLAAGMTAIDVLKSKRTFNSLYRSLRPLLVYLASFSFFTLLFWPYLWESPVQNLIDAFTKMNKFPISYDVLYLSSFIKSTEVPWHYIPVWILITTPLLYIFFFLLGFSGAVKGVIRNGIKLYSNDRERQDLLFVLLFVVPLAAVILLNSALYDGWRHLYFIYAPFLLIAMTGVARLLELMRAGHSGRERLAGLVIGMVVVSSFISTSYQMIRYHPFQNVYFNHLAGNNVGEKFELDYWGLSFRKGLEYIVANDKRSVINLTANTLPTLFNNAIFIGRQDIKRLRLSNIQQADYFLTNYRWHPQAYEFANEVYNVTIGNMKILSVFKLR